MGKILDGLKMSTPVSATDDPPVKGDRPRLEEVRNAVIEFFTKTPDVRRVDVVKLAQIDPEKGIWEAEAEVYVPNATIKALGLPTQKEVLDCRSYLLRLDGRRNVVAYGLVDSGVEREE